MLKFGLETESCHLSMQNKCMDIFQFIDFAADTGFDGVVINVIEKRNLQEGLGALGKDEPEHIKKVSQKIKERGLYVEVDTRGTSYEHLAHMLDVAEMLGADILRTFVMMGNNFSHTNLVGEFSQEGMDLVNKLDSRWIGILFDYGNSIPTYEDPMHALVQCTDKLFSTHLKDQVICKTGDENELEYCMCEKAVGEGACDVVGLSEYIMTHTTLTRLNVETSYPYAGRFTRPVGTGGVTRLDELIEEQNQSLIRGLRYLHHMRASFEKKY